jgi:hypothetical protein
VSTWALNRQPSHLVDPWAAALTSPKSLRCERSGGSFPTAVALDYEVPRQWVHHLVTRYQAQGAAAFALGSRRPHTNARAISTGLQPTMPGFAVGDASAIIGPYLRLLEGRPCLPLERCSKT